MRLLLLALLLSIAALPSVAEVTNKSAAGFISAHTLTLNATPEQAYSALTADIHRWWDAEHSYSGQAENFYLEAKAGGCFCERLANGGSVQHMQVVFADPGKRLRLIGGLGPLQAMAVTGSMDFVLESKQNGITELRYRYSVGGYVPGGLENIAGPVDQVQLGQLQRLQNYLATGSPTQK